MAVRVVERANGDPRLITAKMTREEVAKLLPEKEAPSSFDAVAEGDVIRKFLEKRALAWPEMFRKTFSNFIASIVADIANEHRQEGIL